MIAGKANTAFTCGEAVVEHMSCNISQVESAEAVDMFIFKLAM